MFTCVRVRVPGSQQTSRLFDWIPHQEEALNEEYKYSYCSQLVTDSSSFCGSYCCRPLLGLVLCYRGSSLLVCNPGRRRFFDLPTIPVSGSAVCYFGFDPIGEHFKVLALSELAGDEDVQILTLVDGGKSHWRTLKCKQPHVPFVDWLSPSRNGIFLDGRSYYGAFLKSPQGGTVLMSFDMQSEDFTLTPFPDEATIDVSKTELVKFRGKLALVPYPILYGFFDVWVLDDYNTHSWSKLYFQIPGWEDYASLYRDYVKVDLEEHYHFKGTSATGKLIFAPDHLVRGRVLLLCYDIEGEILSEAEIRNVSHEWDDDQVETFLDYIEEPMLLPGASKDFLRYCFCYL